MKDKVIYFHQKCTISNSFILQGFHLEYNSDYYLKHIEVK